MTSTGGRGDVTGPSLKIARALAKAGRTVVIVDAGTDGAGLAGSTGIAAEPGLREVIAGQVSLEDVLSADSASGVHLIPAGSPALATLPVEAQEQLHQTLETLSASYEQVMILVSPARLKPLLGMLAGALDTAIEIGVSGNSGTSGRLLSEAGIEVMRHRPLGARPRRSNRPAHGPRHRRPGRRGEQSAQSRANGLPAPAPITQQAND